MTFIALPGVVPKNQNCQLSQMYNLTPDQMVLVLNGDPSLAILTLIGNMLFESYNFNYLDPLRKYINDSNRRKDEQLLVQMCMAKRRGEEFR